MINQERKIEFERKKVFYPTKGSLFFKEFKMEAVT